ncbi:MAG: LD-carboxypeptidase [Polaribacter sp.]|nr:LD-carboxypeptidase [Polaribacter sp.]
MSMKSFRPFLVIVFFGIVLSISAQEKRDVIAAAVTTKLIQPPYLQTGDTIAIVAPAGILKNREKVIAKAKKLAESWGLKVIYGENLFNQGGHFAGTDTERAADFQKALNNPNIKAIWAARGGYGTVRILDQLDFTIFKEHPKWIVGYSDITALHSHVHTLGFETIHAMMGSSLGDELEGIVETVATYKKALFGEKLRYKIASSLANKKGTVEGPIVGGNISILASMLGSKSQMNTKGKILFIEEIGEYKYSIDRMLQSLKRAGFFEHYKGLIVGDISNIKKNTTAWGSSIEQLILDVVAEYNFPILFHFPAGHEKDNRALILGKVVKLKVRKKKKSSVVFK